MAQFRLRFTSIALPILTFLLGIAFCCAVWWLFLNPIEGTGLKDTVDTRSAYGERKTSDGQKKKQIDPKSTNVSKVWPAQLTDIAQIASPFERELSLRKILVELDEARVNHLLSESIELPIDSHSRELQSTIIQRLAQITPKLALSRALEMDTQDIPHLVVAVFMEWANIDLDEAISNARALGTHNRNTALKAILEARTDLSIEKLYSIAVDIGGRQVADTFVAQQEIKASIESPEENWAELVVKFQDNSSLIPDLADVAIAWVSKSGLGVLDQISVSMTNLQTRTEVLKSVLVSLSKTDPASAFDYARSLESNPDYSLVKGVVDVWARSNPQIALDAVLKVDNSYLRPQLEKLVIEGWSDAKPYELLENISVLPTKPVDYRASAAFKALRAIARNSPDDAAQLVAKMESGSIRVSAAAGFVEAWSKIDVKAALDWIQTEQANELNRRHLISIVLNDLTEVDPQLAMSTALSQPEIAGGTGLEINVILHMAWKNLDKAVELLPQVREGQTKLSAYQNTASSLVRHGKADRALSLSQELPETDRAEYLDFVISNWAFSEPHGLIESMDRLPSKALRSTAARVLLQASQWRLSEEQIETAKKYLDDKDDKGIE
ncbi:MAG: hypothetical protein OXG24_03020 [Gammaproteobacteria bacterium]|nr:hypothetical protein [Gammaproteobacteria bacterium]